MTNTKTSALGMSLAATVAMTLVACGGATPEPAAPGTTNTTSGTVSCKESNTCKGHASCAGTAQGEKHTCKGSNACAGNVREISKTECDAIKGTVATK